MSKLIGVVLIAIAVILLFPAVALGIALNGFGTFLVFLCTILGIIFIRG